ncbi:MAG: hypothetical protein QNJ22_06845 [Desulfosarcinaceae bacterium]|nr:hypothetical protein [Desulfosarcinaceae bacterium]
MGQFVDRLLPILFVSLVLLPCILLAQDRGSTRSPEIEIHLDLTRQFHEAMRQADRAGTHSLSTNLSERQLEQIAISARFMVETNLRLLQEQAETNALLRELLTSARP